MKLQTIKPRKTGLTGLSVRSMPVDPEPAGGEAVPAKYFFEDNIESVYAGNHDGANGTAVPRGAGESVYDWIARAASTSRDMADMVEEAALADTVKNEQTILAFA
jgi:hypothetical protein